MTLCTPPGLQTPVRPNMIGSRLKIWKSWVGGMVLAGSGSGLGLGLGYGHVSYQDPTNQDPLSLNSENAAQGKTALYV